MKTDRVLTTEQWINEWLAASPHVDPPACDARHVPITSEGNLDPRKKDHGCRCDRWGHPWPDCDEKRKPRLCAAADELRL